MLKKIKLMIVLAAVALGAASCAKNSKSWESEEWQSGDYGGASTLVTEAYLGYPEKIVEVGKGSYTWDERGKFSLGKDTPLPYCRFEIALFEREDSTFRLFLDPYKGDTKNDLGCMASIGDKLFRVEIKSGSFKRDANGDVILTIVFRGGKDYDPYYRYELRARKTSWLR